MPTEPQFMLTEFKNFENAALLLYALPFRVLSDIFKQYSWLYSEKGGRTQALFHLY